MNRQDCLDQAVEAEALANIVSLATDKARLQRQAQDWRERATQIEAQVEQVDAAPVKARRSGRLGLW